MTNFQSALFQELRSIQEKTDAPVMVVKQALIATGGDTEKALEYIASRAKGEALEPPRMTLKQHYMSAALPLAWEFLTVQGPAEYITYAQVADVAAAIANVMVRKAK